jgi:hypothetical protein
MRTRQFWKATFIFPALMLVLAAGCAVPVADGQGVTEKSRQQVVLSRWALRHIQQRHWPDSPAQGAGKFAVGITEEALREMISEAVANGRSRENTHGRPGEIYEYDFGRPIGTTIDGGPASRLRLVVNARGQVITAFPF